jgi:hypothetical protein
MSQSSAGPKLFPDWYLALVGLITALFVGTTIYYHLGAEGVRVKGARIDFDRKFDQRLFEVDGRRAFAVSARGGGDAFVSLVKYRRGTFPFCPLCGWNTLDGSVFNLADFRKGDWLYSRYTFPGRPIAYHLRTGELVQSAKTKEGAASRAPEPADEPFYVKMGFTFDDGLRVSRQLDPKRELSVINEGCVIFTAAFLCFYALFLVMLPVLVIRWAARRRAARGAASAA